MLDKKSLNRLLDSVYELEALVYMAIKRDDCSDELLRLIDNKVKAVAADYKSVGFSESKESTSQGNETQVNKINEPKNIKNGEGENLSSYPSEEELFNEVKKDLEDVDLNVAGNLNYESSGEFYEYSIESEYPDEYMDDNEEDRTYRAEKTHKTDIENDKKESTFDSHSLEERMGDKELNSEEKVTGDKEEETESNSHLKGRLVFSVNDRYRFKKSLFKNSDAEFNTTMAFVASMDNYEEAEEYFLGELGFDGKNKDVVDFLAILEKYFN